LRYIDLQLPTEISRQQTEREKQQKEKGGEGDRERENDESIQERGGREEGGKEPELRLAPTVRPFLQFAGVPIVLNPSTPLLPAARSTRESGLLYWKISAFLNR
jgi:hypothetical protein